MFKIDGKRIEKVGFLGFGKSNRGVYSYLSSHYTFETAVRANEKIDLDFVNADKTFFGACALSDISEDVIFVSPSARREASELLSAQEAGVILSSDAEFFFKNSDADVYAVTGSDGKSTTTHLVSQLLKNSYTDSVAFGNIGEPMTPHLDDKYGTAYAAELSSFQLNYFKPKSKRALITNISKNHLNWHKSFDEYISAKLNIFENAIERVLNYDCPILNGIAHDYSFYAVYSMKKSEEELRKSVNSELYFTLSDGFITANGEPILDTRKIRINGIHNVQNFMAASALTFGLFTKSKIEELAESFSGLRHRCELIAEIGGVKYYDSSIDSSPKRCEATLRSMEGKVTVILGGRSKGLDFTPLVPILNEKAKQVILTGECAREIERILIRANFSGCTIPHVRLDSFYDAVEYAKKSAISGDSVILSPAATSYDAFKNFEERGDAFRNLIEGLNDRKE